MQSILGFVMHLAHPRAPTPSIYHGQRHCALVWYNSSNWPPRNTKMANKMIWMMTMSCGCYGDDGCHDCHWQQRCNRLCRGRWRESSVTIDVMTANITISLVMTTLQWQRQWGRKQRGLWRRRWRWRRRWCWRRGWRRRRQWWQQDDDGNGEGGNGGGDDNNNDNHNDHDDNLGIRYIVRAPVPWLSSPFWSCRGCTCSTACTCPPLPCQIRCSTMSQTTPTPLTMASPPPCPCTYPPPLSPSCPLHPLNSPWCHNGPAYG